MTTLFFAKPSSQTTKFITKKKKRLFFIYFFPFVCKRKPNEKIAQMLQIVLQPHPKPVYLELLVYIYKMRKKSTYDQDSGLLSRTEREFGQKKKPNLWDFTEIGRLYFFFSQKTWRSTGFFPVPHFPDFASSSSQKGATDWRENVCSSI